jgi:hypothetical protein
MKNKSRETKNYFIPIDIPVYRTKSFIVVNVSDEELLENLIKEGVSEKEAKCLVKDSKVTRGYQGMTALYDGYSVMRYKKVSDVTDLNIIAHESFHAVCEIMRFIDMPLKESSEEGFAYLLGFIVEHYEKILKDFQTK